MSTAQAPVATVNKGLSADGATFIGVIIFINVLSGLSVLLRIMGRVKEFRTLHRDDYAIILAWVTCLTTITLTTYWCCVGGIGWSIVEIPPTQLLTFFKIFFGLQLLYVFSVFIVKVSILLLYIRIFDTPKFKQVAWSVMGLCVAWYIASTTVAIIQCLPVQAAWDLAITDAKCMDKQQLYWGVGISNLLLDVLILCLPLPVIWHLHLDKQRKVALTVIFLTGSIVCISSILRVTSIGTIKNSDFTKTVYGASVWSSVEANVAIIAACLPTLGHVFLRFKKKMQSHATPTYDPERSQLTARSQLDTMKSGNSRKVFDPYSTDVDHELGHKMGGWRSGTNEAYVEMKTPDSPFEDENHGVAGSTTPYETSNVFITTQVKSAETIEQPRK